MKAILVFSLFLMLSITDARGQTEIDERVRRVEEDYQRSVEADGWTLIERATWVCCRLGTVLESDGYRDVQGAVSIGQVHFSTSQKAYGGIIIGTGEVGVMYDNFDYHWRSTEVVHSESNGVHIFQHRVNVEFFLTGEFSWWAAIEDPPGQSTVVHIYTK